jgi:hypothetical protein
VYAKLYAYACKNSLVAIAAINIYFIKKFGKTVKLKLYFSQTMKAFTPVEKGEPIA